MVLGRMKASIYNEKTLVNFHMNECSLNKNINNENPKP